MESTTDLAHLEPAAQLVQIADDLSAALSGQRFSAPVAHVYDPLDYAGAVHRRYLERFGRFEPAVLLVGMNPGPWGMAQTGVPFGAVEPVRDWLGLEGPVGRPDDEHPKRPVEGFATPRNEVSGARLWGWAQDRFGTPKRFFSRFFVHNYCPLLFLEAGARNVTPDKLKKAERDALLPPCDDALRRVVRALGVRRVLGVGAWAEKRARTALAPLMQMAETDGANDGQITIGRILHPSPASPAANRGWAEQAERELRDQGILNDPVTTSLALRASDAG